MFSSACFGHPSFPKCNNPSWRLQCSFSSHMKGVSLWARPSFTNSINKCCAHGRNKYCNSSLTKAHFPDVYNIMVFKVVIVFYNTCASLGHYPACSAKVIFIVFSTFVVFVLLPRDCCQTCLEILDIHFGTTLQHFCSRCVSPGNPKPSLWDNTPSLLLTVWFVQLYFWATFHHLCCVFVICWPACSSKISPESGSP